jgi:hypothetical protein
MENLVIYKNELGVRLTELEGLKMEKIVLTYKSAKAVHLFGKPYLIRTYTAKGISVSVIKTNNDTLKIYKVKI